MFRPNMFFLLLLPPIIFESGYSLHKVCVYLRTCVFLCVYERVSTCVSSWCIGIFGAHLSTSMCSGCQGNFFQNIGSITLFAVIGTAISAFIVGGGIYFLGQVRLLELYRVVESPTIPGTGEASGTLQGCWVPCNSWDRWASRTLYFPIPHLFQLIHHQGFTDEQLVQLVVQFWTLMQNVLEITVIEWLGDPGDRLGNRCSRIKLICNELICVKKKHTHIQDVQCIPRGDGT